MASASAVTFGAATFAAAPAWSATTLDFRDGYAAAPFSYGRLNADGTVTQFASCADGAFCGGVQYESVNAFDYQTLVLHPGNDLADNTAVIFTSPTAGTYHFHAWLSNLYSGGNGVGVSLFTSPSDTLIPLGHTAGVFPGTYILDLDFTLDAGDFFALVIDSNGDNTLDSTAVVGRITSEDPAGQTGDSLVPEPASWALMIVGFGMIGAALRQRRVTVRFA